MEQRIMAVPVSVDTLAMYVNKDLLNTAGIPTVPSEWSAFQQAYSETRETGFAGKIVAVRCRDRNRLQCGALAGYSFCPHDAERLGNERGRRYADVRSHPIGARGFA